MFNDIPTLKLHWLLGVKQRYLCERYDRKQYIKSSKWYKTQCKKLTVLKLRWRISLHNIFMGQMYVTNACLTKRQLDLTCTACKLTSYLSRLALYTNNQYSKTISFTYNSTDKTVFQQLLMYHLKERLGERKSIYPMSSALSLSYIYSVCIIKFLIPRCNEVACTSGIC